MLSFLKNQGGHRQYIMPFGSSRTYKQFGDHAIVIGGSITGLLSARVLADKFESVTVLETDRLPCVPIARKGVPQSVQPHLLFTRGYRLLEEMFPGIGNDLSTAGALTIDWVREFYLFGKFGWNITSSSPSDIVSFTCSRPLLEWTIRQRLSEFSNVRFLEQHRVIGLIHELNESRVTGIFLQLIDGRTEDKLSASLVVDASGRRSQAPQWLESLGFTSPPETVVNPFLGYATRRYREPEGFCANWKVMLISQSPPHGTRLGYLAKIEGGEWIATLGGYGKDFPPIDNVGFLEFAHSLPSPEFYAALAAAEPTSPIYAHRATANRQRHYEKVALPRGFVALGDAVCALCPVYGQGITVSALSARVLRNWLNHACNQLSQSSFSSSLFQKNLAKSNSSYWNLATRQDLKFPTTTGGSKKSQSGGPLSWYVDSLLRLSKENEDIHTLIIGVMQAVKSPFILLHPSIALHVISYEIKKHFTQKI